MFCNQFLRNMFYNISICEALGKVSSCHSCEPCLVGELFGETGDCDADGDNDNMRIDLHSNHVYLLKRKNTQQRRRGGGELYRMKSVDQEKCPRNEQTECSHKMPVSTYNWNILDNLLSKKCLVHDVMMVPLKKYDRITSMK